jgi:hypothetical protein
VERAVQAVVVTVIHPVFLVAVEQVQPIRVVAVVVLQVRAILEAQAVAAVQV